MNHQLEETGRISSLIHQPLFFTGSFLFWGCRKQQCSKPSKNLVGEHLTGMVYFRSENNIFSLLTILTTPPLTFSDPFREAAAEGPFHEDPVAQEEKPSDELVVEPQVNMVNPEDPNRNSVAELHCH